VPKFMPTSGCLLSGQLKNFPHLPLFHHDPPNVGGPLEKEKALHTSHLQSGMSGKVCVMTPWPCDEVKSIPFKSASHFARSGLSQVDWESKSLLQAEWFCCSEKATTNPSKMHWVYGSNASSKMSLKGRSSSQCSGRRKTAHARKFFSVQRLHGFRQVVQHVQLHVAK
jgi:hypothetical protein